MNLTEKCQQASEFNRRVFGYSAKAEMALNGFFMPSSANMIQLAGLAVAITPVFAQNQDRKPI